MNILVLNQDWFVEEWRASGHNIVTCGLASHLQVVLHTAHIHIDRVIEMLPDNFDPELIVILDNSGPVILAGLEETSIPVIFYSVDTHHHHALHKYLAHLFDYTFIAQKDYLENFKSVGSQAEWLPLWASRYIDDCEQKQHEAVFVGNLNPELNPERVWFFNELNKLIKVDTRIGRFWEIFPFSEIVVNQTVKKDLNFRVFEAMMSGAMLLTEKTENGLLDLFTDHKHLVTYTQGVPPDAAEKIKYYLANKKLAREIGLAGREEILKKHTSKHRADSIAAMFSLVQKRESPVKFLSAAANYTALGYRSERIDTAVTLKAFISALKCLDLAFKRAEPIDTQLACYATCAFIKYDQHIMGTVGQEMIHRAREIYPDEPIFKIASIRDYLNHGKYELARQLANGVSADPVEQTFSKSELVVRMILEGYSFQL